MAGINSWRLNSVPLNDEGASVLAYGSGVLLSVEQEVQLLVSGVGSLVDVEQLVLTLGSGAIVQVEQRILSSEEITFFTKNGWDMSVTLDGYTIPRDQIMDASVTHEVGNNSRAEVKITPGAGTYDMYQYQGKILIISARVGTEFKRLFKGLVDIPTVDLIREYITIQASSDRETLIRNNLTPEVASVGYYSPTVFGVRSSVYQEVVARLETTPFDLDFDPYDNYSITSWTPKATADYTKSNSDVYYRNPSIRIESSRNVVNNVEILFNYNYQRLHQESLSYIWNSGLETCEFLTKGNTLPTRNMIRAAAEKSGWFIDNIGFTDLWQGGFYYCNGVAIGWVNTKQNVILQQSGSVDVNGNNTSTSNVVRTADLNTILARAASWTCRKRYTQNIEEQYTLTVKSPQSQLLYGVKEQNLAYSLQSDFDPSEWEDQSKYDVSFSGTQVASSNANTYYINRDTDASELANATITALNKAKTAILASHRDTEIDYEEFLNVDVQLKHTISINTSRIVGKGKAKTITHKLSSDGVASTSVVVLLYRSTGTQAETSLVPPARPSSIAPVQGSSVALGTRWGINPAISGSAYWTGYVGNKWITVLTGGVGRFGIGTNTYYTTYQQSFTVDTPAISSSKRSDSIRTASGTYNMSIPNDNLSVIFVDS